MSWSIEEGFKKIRKMLKWEENGVHNQESYLLSMNNIYQKSRYQNEVISIVVMMKIIIAQINPIQMASQERNKKMIAGHRHPWMRAAWDWEVEVLERAAKTLCENAVIHQVQVTVI